MKTMGKWIVAGIVIAAILMCVIIGGVSGKNEHIQDETIVDVPEEGTVDIQQDTVSDVISDQEEQVTDETETEIVPEEQSEPEEQLELEEQTEAEDTPKKPAAVEVPTVQEQTLLDSELVEFDPGMVYRFEGDGLVFQPKGWNVALELPEEWKNDVSVFSTHPYGDTLTITVVPNALIEAYMTALNRPAMNSYYDYSVQLICLPKEDNPREWSETAVLLYEDLQVAYYLDTNLSRSLDSQYSLMQRLLIDKIGQEQYDTITAGFQLSQDEAGKLFVFEE